MHSQVIRNGLILTNHPYYTRIYCRPATHQASLHSTMKSFKHYMLTKEDVIAAFNLFCGVCGVCGIGTLSMPALSTP